MQGGVEYLDLVVQWEVRSWSRALKIWRNYLKHLPPGRPKALALGERDGGLSLLLAQFGCDVVCSDLHGPTEQAVSLHSTLGWDWAMDYQSIDLTAIPHADASFDVVIFKSVIGALCNKEKQRSAIQEMHRVLKPGGVLLFAEILRGTVLHR